MIRCTSASMIASLFILNCWPDVVEQLAGEAGLGQAEGWKWGSRCGDFIGSSTNIVSPAFGWPVGIMKCGGNCWVVFRIRLFWDDYSYDRLWVYIVRFESLGHDHLEV